MSGTLESTPPVSVIVPLATAAEPWRQLLSQLQLPAHWEVLLAAPTPPPDDWHEQPGCRWLCCPASGRGAQMNAAAAVANGRFLWFVHADSQPPPRTAAMLQQALAACPQAVHYFDLRFYDGGWYMRINEWGARWRCAVFANPFGDQALCVPRQVFINLGGYTETAEAGEDHLFVLKAARRGIKIRRTGAAMPTSARTYRQRGWWRVVCEYQKIWWRQWRKN